MSLMHAWTGDLVCLVLAVATLLSMGVIQLLSDEPEIALVIGEPYEDMRQRSTATIGPAIPGHCRSTSPVLMLACVGRPSSIRVCDPIGAVPQHKLR